MDVKNKVVAITGAAGGLGSEMAKTLAMSGAQVWLLDLELEKCKTLEAEITAAGCTAHSAKLDVTSETEWEAVIAQIVSESGRLDVLVNNAGINIRKPIEEMVMYLEIPGIVEGYMQEINKITGRDYHLFNYYGAPDAERVIVIMKGFPDRFETLNVILNHYGYLDETIAKKQKRKRNMPILEQELEKNPEDFFAQYYLGNEYLALNDLNKASVYYLKSYEEAKKHNMIFAHLYLRMITCLEALGDFKQSLYFIAEALNIFPLCTDFEFIRAVIFFRTRRYTLAIQSLNRCLTMGVPPAPLEFMRSVFSDDHTSEPSAPRCSAPSHNHCRGTEASFQSGSLPDFQKHARPAGIDRRDAHPGQAGFHVLLCGSVGRAHAVGQNYSRLGKHPLVRAVHHPMDAQVVQQRLDGCRRAKGIYGIGEHQQVGVQHRIPHRHGTAQYEGSPGDGGVRRQRRYLVCGLRRVPNRTAQRCGG